LAILPHFINIPDPGVAFDFTMHLGTVLAIILYFRRDLRLLLNFRTTYFANMLLSLVATMVMVYLLKGVAKEHGRQMILIAANLIIWGAFMWLADRFAQKVVPEKMKDRRQWSKALIIGLSQALAIFPGVSRSGVTLGFARLVGLSRLEAARYSFLLSVPVILGGGIYESWEMFHGAINFNLGLCLWGIVVSFAVGFITIHFFMEILGRIGLGIFFAYRLVLGLAVLYVYFWH
ncbi:MAG: undecaprenyl-diphosphate phosphatase, partial [Pseudomonadota bacterium]